MKKSFHSALSSSPAPLAFLGAVPTLTHGTRAGLSPSQGQQLLLTPWPRSRALLAQNTLAQEQCHGLQARQLRCSHGFPGPTKRRRLLFVPGYNYKDGNNWPGQPNQTHHQKALCIPKPSKLQWCRETSRVGCVFLGKRWQLGGGQAGTLSSRAWSTPVPSTHMGICHLLLGEKKLQNDPISLMHCKFQGRIMLGSSAGVVVVELQSLGDSGCLEMRHHAGTGPQPTPGVPGQWQHPSSFCLPTKARGARALPRLAGKAHE